jgi:predicted Zn-dependent protease
LLVLSNSEAELANVLGHEIGHVVARHAAQRDVKAKTVGLATVLGAVGAVMAGGDGRAVAGVQMLGAGMMSAYGRDQEREADRIAQDLAATVGVDPMGMSEFLRGLDKTIRLERGFSRETGFFDTHPSTPERVAEATTRAVVLRWTPGFELAPSRAEFFALLDGLAIGKPAAEGVIRDGRFLHADLDVSLAFPYGWRINNERSRVIAFTPGGDGVVMLELQGEGMDPRAAASEYGSDQALQFNRGDAIRIGPLEAYRVRGLVPTQAGAFEMELTFIAYQGQIYRLSAGARQGHFGKYAGTLRGFARSFRALRPGERAEINELRLRIVTVEEGEDLLALNLRTGNEWDLNRTAVINGLTLGDPLVVGSVMKVAIREPYVAGQNEVDPDALPPMPGPMPAPDESADPGAAGEARDENADRQTDEANTEASSNAPGVGT